MFPSHDKGQKLAVTKSADFCGATNYLFTGFFPIDGKETQLVFSERNAKLYLVATNAQGELGEEKRLPALDFASVDGDPRPAIVQFLLGTLALTVRGL